MNAASIPNAHAGLEAEKVIAGVRDRFLAAFSNQILSIYLLGSHATGSATRTSDVDFALIFRGATDAVRHPAVVELLDAVRSTSSVPLDILILDEDDVKQGVKPHLKAGKLLYGPDIVADSPLKPTTELIVFYAGLGVHFIRVLRSQPKILQYPLDYPEPNGAFHGYEINGVRFAQGRYKPGFNVALNLIVGIAGFRLAQSFGVITSNKRMTVSKYREYFPDDPSSTMLEDMYEICRIRLEGSLPESDSDRQILSRHCGRILEFENDFLKTCISNLESFAMTSNSTLLKNIRDFANSIDSKLFPESKMLNAARNRLGR